MTLPSPQRLRPRRHSRSETDVASGARLARMAAPDNQLFALRQLVDELAAQLRSGVDKLADLPQETGERLAHELGLVRREEFESVELRLAQLEHRLRLLEQRP